MNLCLDIVSGRCQAFTTPGLPAILLRYVLQHLELPSCHRTRPNVPDLPALYYIVKRLHNLFFRGLAVQSVDLQHIDICAQSFHTRIDRIEDMLSAESDLVHIRAIVGGHGCYSRLSACCVNSEVAF